MSQPDPGSLILGTDQTIYGVKTFAAPGNNNIPVTGHWTACIPAPGSP